MTKIQFLYDTFSKFLWSPLHLITPLLKYIVGWSKKNRLFLTSNPEGH